MFITKEQLDKLPKYARAEIARLRSDLEAAESAIRKAVGEEESRITIDPYVHPTGLPERAIEFRVGGRRDERVEVRLYDDCIEVFGGDTLAIQPQAANVVRIYVRRM